MNALLAYCGLDCGGCPIHLATLETDENKKRSLRADIAQTCREKYGMDIQASDVGDCDGCRGNSGRLFVPCSTCAVRSCARKREYETCAACSEFVCAKLQHILADEPAARTRLEAIRTSR